MEPISPLAQPVEDPWKITGRIVPARLGPLYQLGMTLTALVMVILPVLYLGLIGGVGWAIYIYAVSDVPDIGNRSNNHSDLFVAYVPMIAGAIVILFMIKPLFARRAKFAPPVEVTREQQPRLFAFIEQICALVRAPRPRRIVVDLNVNASAGFTRGWFGLVRNDLTLTIGLPLVTGLTVREFGGVCAHEFGHFAQGAGMRLTYVIRSLNGWFARLVYERDTWDEFFREAARRIDIRIGIIFYLARFMVWLTRKILWVFMWVGHGVSCFMLRQMEFDADYYETQVAGSDAFVRTCQALPVIGTGWGRAVSTQRESFAAKRLVDDLATYTALETRRVSPQTRADIEKAVKSAKTGWFDTHPADSDRLRAADDAKAPGVLSGDNSATSLFGEFPALARQATAAYYQHVCEIDLAKVQLVPLDQVVGEVDAQEESDKVTQDFFKEIFSVRTLLVVSPGELRRASPLGELQAESRAAILRHRAAVAEVAPRMAALLQSDAANLRAVQAQTLIAAGFKLKPGEWGLKKSDPAEALAAVADSRLRITEKLDALSEPLAATRERLVAALRAYFITPLPEGLDAASVDEIDRGARIVIRFEELAGSIVNLRNQLAAFEILLSNRPKQLSNVFLQVVRTTGNDIAREAQRVTVAFDRLEYPFSHARGKVLLADFLVDCEGHADESVEAYLGGKALFDRLLTIYQRLMGRLAQLALLGERVLGTGDEQSTCLTE